MPSRMGLPCAQLRKRGIFTALSPARLHHSRRVDSLQGLMPPITACPPWPDVLSGLPWQGVGQLATPPASNLTVMSTALYPSPI